MFNTQLFSQTFNTNHKKEAKKIKKSGWISMSGNLEKDILDYYNMNDIQLVMIL